MTPLIEAAGLTKHFLVRAGSFLHRHTMPLRAVEDVAIDILTGEQFKINSVYRGEAAEPLGQAPGADEYFGH